MCDATPETGPRARHVITGTPTGKGQDSAGAVEAEQLIEDQAGPLERSVSRYDAGVFDVERPLVRLRIEIGESVTHDVTKSEGDGDARLHIRRVETAAGRPSTIEGRTGCGLAWAGATKGPVHLGAEGQPRPDRVRANNFGSVTVTSVAAYGGGQLHAISPGPFVLSYGRVRTDQTIDVVIRWDHRVCDAALIARILSLLEQVLNTEIAAELRKSGPDAQPKAVRAVRT